MPAHSPPDSYDYSYGTDLYVLYYHTEPSKRSFRDKLEHFLNSLLELGDGDSKDLILYEAVRAPSKVTIRALSKRIRSIRSLHKVTSLGTSGRSQLPSPRTKLAISIMDIVFLRCLFSIGREWESDYYLDLSRAALPCEDVRVRLGEYNLLYDYLTKEWTLWMAT